MEILKSFHQQCAALHSDVLSNCKDSAYKGKDGGYLKFPSEDIEYYNDAGKAMEKLTLDLTNLKVEKFPAGLTKQQEKVMGMIKRTLEDVRTVIQIAEMRHMFHERLLDYIVARTNLETKLAKITGFIESFEHVTPDQVPEVIKTQVTNLFGEATNETITTARNLNALTMFSIDRKPDILGHYSWFALFDKREKKLIMREPYHQFVSKREGRDVENNLRTLIDLVILSTTRMALDNTTALESLDKLEVLIRSDLEKKVRGHLTQDKVQIMFPLLFENDVKDVDTDPLSPEFHSSKSSQSGDDLTGMVSDAVNKMVRGELPKSAQKVVIEKPNISVDDYFDCIDTSNIKEEVQSQSWTKEMISPLLHKRQVLFEKPKIGILKPMATSPSLQRKSFTDDDEESVRSSHIGFGVSSRKLLSYAEKTYYLCKETVEENEEKQVLFTVKKDIERVRDKVEKFGDSEVDEIDIIQRKLFKLALVIDKKINKIEEVEQKRKVLPKAKLMVWSGDILEYQNFRKQMVELLDYGHSDLDLTTLKEQIKGPKANEALRCLFNVKDIHQAFRILDRKYGNILMVLPQLKNDLASLKNLPNTMKDENYNIGQILNVYRALDKHGMADAIDLGFIQQFRNKLTRENRKMVTDSKVSTCEEFINAITEIQTTNDELLITSAEFTEKKNHGNTGITGESSKLKYKKKRNCLICDEPHPTYLCESLSKEEDKERRFQLVKNKKGCIKCFEPFQPGRHECRDFYKKYICKVHKVNHALCKCRGNKPDLGALVVDGNTEEKEPTTVQNRATINNSFIGAVGFEIEILYFLSKRKDLIRVLVAYDNYCSHTSMDRELAEDLGLELSPIGSIKTNCYLGSVSQDGYKAKAIIQVDNEQKELEFIVGQCKQELDVSQYRVPEKWGKKYKINKFPTSPSGMNFVIIGKDNCHLFPEVLETEVGLQLARSRISGKYIVSGRTISEENPCLNQNGNMSISHNRNVVQERDPVMVTDRIVESPLKRCLKCTNCLDCKKEMKPDEIRQKKQTEIIKSSLSFDPEQGYSVKYPKNKILSELPENKEDSLRMMKSLESKLIKNGLLDSFNVCLKEFINSGGVAPTSNFPEMVNMKKSYIPLCYALANNDKATTKIRICTNSSYKKSSKYPSFNDACIDGPDYLNNLDSIVTRWRFAASTAHGDISKCYHRVRTCAEDNSLRRLWLKPALGVPGQWQEYCLTCISFGDILGGCCAQLCIYDCAEQFMSWESQMALRENVYMDDISLLLYKETEAGCENLVEDVNQGLEKGRLPVKGWIKSFDNSPPIKFLSYLYHPTTDSIQVRPKINWSPKKRGARISKNATNEEELKQHCKENPVTRRALAAITMGTLHDPLYLMGPFLTNLKVLYRKVIQLDLGWDEKVPKDIEEELLSFLRPFLKMDKVLFPRRVAFFEAAIIEILLFFDGSNTAMGVSIFIKNIFKCGKVIVRLLKNKVKLVPNDANTTPRSELLSCLICMRICTLLQSDLKTFFECYQGQVRFKAYGDSSIVLCQLLKDGYNFRQWVSLRVSEIQQLSKSIKPKIEFYHIPSALNRADILTRVHHGDPCDLPYIGDCDVDTSKAVLYGKDNASINDLPEVDKKQVVNENVMITTPVEGVKSSKYLGELDLNYVVLYNVMKTNPLKPDKEEEIVNPIITKLLTDKSRYFLARNTIARVLYFGTKETEFKVAQEKAELIIFREYQQSVDTYIKAFKGSPYYTTVTDGVTYVTGRKIEGRETKLKLVPPGTLLYKRITECFHQKYHYFGPNYIRAQLQLNHYYVPSAVKRLKKLQDRCKICIRKKKQQRLYTEMGSVSERRLNFQYPMRHIQSDVAGPVHCKGFVDPRKTKKLWILVCICQYTRFITLHLLESMSASVLLKTFRVQFLRFGKSESIQCDFGTNYSGARHDLEEEVLSDHDLKEVSLALQSQGTKLIQRCPKSPWVQGSAEHAVGLTKKVIETKHKLTVFQWDRLLQETMQILNDRPIGTFSDLELLTPNSLRPIHSQLSGADNLENYCLEIKKAKEEFSKKWFSLYHHTVLAQSKWMTSTSLSLKEGSIVLINDLLTPLYYPVLGRISKIEEDSTGIPRYFTVEYKRMKVDNSARRPDEKYSYTKKYFSVRRPASSLLLLLTPEDDQCSDNEETQALPADSTPHSTLGYQGQDTEQSTRRLYTFSDILDSGSLQSGTTDKGNKKLKVKYQNAGDGIIQDMI